jgi:hypothetical protein
MSTAACVSYGLYSAKQSTDGRLVIPAHGMRSWLDCAEFAFSRQPTTKHPIANSDVSGDCMRSPLHSVARAGCSTGWGMRTVGRAHAERRECEACCAGSPRGN